MKQRPQDPLQAVEAAALRLLARREHARAELARKLLARGHAAEAVAAVLDRLEAEGSLSEARFAETYARSRAERGYGPLRIRQELRRHGIDEARIEAALAALEIDWAARARELCRKRFGPEPPRDWKARARRLRYLQNRGFDPDFLRDFEAEGE
ncbi:MAG: regulatory protein RecX [Gammaproteobacteria bacterium]|nr:MAG: regulatory protein RecX [Gammaproteobacteria bacterium]